MTICPEDVYFSKNMQDYGIGKVADWDSASAFSTESIYNEDSFGGHNFWLSDEKWPDRILLPYCCAVIFHVGNCDVFKKIYNENSHFFKRNMLIFITLHDSNFIDIVKPYLPNAIFTVIENNGLDIGGFLHSMRLLIQHPNYNNIRFFYKFHTKTHDAWRQSMLLPLVNNYTKIEAELFNKNIPIIVGSKKTCCTNKLVNRNYMKDILDRNHENFKNFLHNDWREYMDEYIFEPDNYETNPHNSLNINPDFYKYYENDLQTLSNADLITHFEKFGKNEFHRICNPCYIKKFSKQSYFIAGTIFMCNKEYLKIFENINFEDEFNILENGYVLNTIPRRTHAWEYLFGLLAYCGNGYIISITESGNMIKMIDKYNEFDINIYKNCNKSIKNNWVQHFNKVGKNENRIYSHNTLRKKQAIINQNILSARLAIFLLVPLDNTSGGYRTLLNYMQKLTENNIYIDIYLGYDFDSINCYNGLSTLNVNIEHVVNIIAGFNVLDIKKYNFYLGFNVQRNYDILIANAWQTADAVYYNKSYCKHICYVIQDLEYLFYTDPMKKIEYCIKNGYKNEYKYYCLSNYLSQVFTHGFKKQYVYSSILGVDNKIYYNKNYTREKSIIIAYYTYKKGRLPELIENIINKLSITYKCYVFPCNYNKNNNNVINMGCLSINALNEIYNTCTVGIVMSNTNPSRLGFEMVASGLKVIEYDSEFTKYDMPNEYFTKIKNDNNIEHVVNNLINSPFIYSQDYVDSITIDNECNNFLNYINNMM
jgi:hypothetical protein